MSIAVIASCALVLVAAVLWVRIATNPLPGGRFGPRPRRELGPLIACVGVAAAAIAVVKLAAGSWEPGPVTDGPFGLLFVAAGLVEALRFHRERKERQPGSFEHFLRRLDETGRLRLAEFSENVDALKVLQECFDRGVSPEGTAAAMLACRKIGGG
jgi:hypothetical protein